MSEGRDYSDLFASGLVRHSLELASTLWGVSVCLVTRDLSAVFPVTAPGPVVALTNALLEHKLIRKEFELQLQPLLLGAPDWSGPRWFQPCDGVRCLVTATGGTSGTTFLVCVPLVHNEENEEAERTRLSALLRTLKNAEAKSAVDFVPVLSMANRRKLQTHMSTLAREMDLLLARKTRRATDTPVRTPALPASSSGIIGESAAAEEIRRKLKALATQDAALLIWGEVGSGRRTAAKALHQISARRSHPMVLIECQSTPAAQILSMYLGDKWRLGMQTELEKMAMGGTVVLHEATFLPPLMQQYLLHYCDTWFGRSAPPFRVIATTSLPIQSLDASGTLRAELAALLRGNAMRLPPLRERKQDVPLLVQDMLRQLRGQEQDLPVEIRRDVLKALQSCEWLGNLWELKGEVRQMAAAARGRTEVTLQEVSARLLGNLKRPEASSPDRPERALSLPEAIENLERSVLSETLMATKWNRSKTAKILGISRRNLIRKISHYALDRRKRREPDAESTGETPTLQE